jgi:hypothetical protein
VAGESAVEGAAAAGGDAGVVGVVVTGALELCPMVLAGAGLAAVSLVLLDHGPHMNKAPTITNAAMMAAIVPRPIPPVLRRSRSVRLLISSLIFVLRGCSAENG